MTFVNEQDIIEDLVETLGNMGQKVKTVVRKTKREAIQKAIRDYLKKLQGKEQELLNLIQKKHQDLTNKQRLNELLNSISKTDLSKRLDEASSDLREAVRSKEEEKILKDLHYLFTTGYKLVMILREYFTGEKIEYEVATEKGNAVFNITEDQLLYFSRPSISSLELSIHNGEINIEYRQKINIGSTLQKQATQIYSALDGDGSTFWSKGKRILENLQKETELSGGVQGLNFGHFFEAYTIYNGNSINFDTNQHPSNLEFAATLLALRNSTKFYQGGDVGNKQLKANEATITNISTIRYQLNNILKILNNEEKQSVKKQVEEIRASFRSSGAEDLVIKKIKQKEEEIEKYFNSKNLTTSIEIYLGQKNK